MSKYKIQNIDELSESRELLENKPNKFTNYFIYIILALIICFFIWSWFSTKDIVITANGIVEPNFNTYDISTLVDGKIEKVNYTNGEYVEKGATILTIDVTNSKNQLSNLENQKKLINKYIIDLKKLANSIRINNNFISNKNNYYAEYNEYLSELNIVNNNISENINDKNYLEQQLNSLKTIENSIKNNKTYNDINSPYYYDYKNYENSKQKLQNEISNLQDSYNNVLREQNLILDEDDISNNELQDGSNPTNSYQTQLNSLSNQIFNCKKQLNLLNDSYLSQFDSKIQETNSQIQSLNGETTKDKLTKDLDKWQMLTQIDSTLDTYNLKLTTLNENIEELKSEVSNGEIKANESGILYMPENLMNGEVLRTGQAIGEIIPNSNNYIVKIYIPNDKIGNIKKGYNVKYSFLAFPYEEYGFLNGSIQSISDTSEINNKTETSYYIAIGTLNSTTLKNSQNQEGNIKLGMQCEAKIIVRKEKMLFYILNQLGIRTNNL